MGSSMYISCCHTYCKCPELIWGFIHLTQGCRWEATYFRALKDFTTRSYIDEVSVCALVCTSSYECQGI